MKDYMLEVCVDSVESALEACSGGAKRLELCGNLIIGGTTPSPALFQKVKELCPVPVRVLIRPRFGDFCYTDHEFAIIREDIAGFLQMGAEGVVIGTLQKDGQLDMQKMGILVEEAGSAKVTLHRAFDLCKDPWQALEQAVELGIDTILTSGQKNSAVAGAELLGGLRERAGGRIHILAGGGIGAGAIRELYPLTGLTNYHMSGKVTLDSVMTYRKEGVNMGLPSLSEYEVWRTSSEKVAQAVQCLESLQTEEDQ